VVGVALSAPEQRKLAEIEKRLSAEDPRLAQAISNWSLGPSLRAVVTLIVGVVASVATFVAGGAVTNGHVGIVLVMLGTLGLLLGLVAGVRMLQTTCRWPRERGK